MTRGPIPNRSNNLSRPRERKGSSESNRNTIPIRKGDMQPVTIPEANPNWHEVATLIFEGLKTSGQAVYYQNSDWAVAYAVCDEFSEYKLSGRRNAQILSAILSTLGSLLATEGDRRRVRVELELPKDEGEDAAVVAMNDYRASLGV